MFSLISTPEPDETVVIVMRDGSINTSTYDGEGFVAHLLNRAPVYYSRNIVEAVYRYTPSSAP